MQRDTNIITSLRFRVQNVAGRGVRAGRTVTGAFAVVGENLADEDRCTGSFRFPDMIAGRGPDRLIRPETHPNFFRQDVSTGGEATAYSPPRVALPPVSHQE
jgi:hypothetical protein